MAALTVVFSLLSKCQFLLMGDTSNGIIMAVCIVVAAAAAAAAAAVPLLTTGHLMRLRFGSHPRKGCRGCLNEYVNICGRLHSTLDLYI